MEATEACKQASSILTLVRDSWLAEGPPSLHEVTHVSMQVYAQTQASEYSSDPVEKCMEEEGASELA